MTFFAYFYSKKESLASLLLFVFLPQPSALSAPLTFMNDHELLAANKHCIYHYDLATPILKRSHVFHPTTTLDNIVYQHATKTVLVTTRHGMDDGGYYNNLLIIPDAQETPMATMFSSYYWPTWNNCAQIQLSPNGNRLLVKKAHQQTHTPYHEPCCGSDYFQQLAVLPEDRNPENEVPFIPNELEFPDFHQTLQRGEISDDANMVLITTYHGQIFLWNPTTQKTSWLKTPSHDYLHVGTLSSNGTWAFAAAFDRGFLYSIDKENPDTKLVTTFGHDAGIYVNGHIDLATFSSNGSHLLIVSHQPEDYKEPTKFHLLVFNVAAQEIEYRLAYLFTDGHKTEAPTEAIKELLTSDFPFETPFQACALSPNAKIIASLSNRGVLRLINAEDKSATILHLSQKRAH